MKESLRNSGNISRDALSGRSEFLKVVGDFAEYVHKEYTNESRSILVCASDELVGGGKFASLHTVLGGRDAMHRALTTMMREDRFRDMFRLCRDMADDADILAQDVSSIRKHLKVGYTLAVVCALWTLFCIALTIIGHLDMFPTVSTVFLMAYLGWMLYRDIRVNRLRLESFEARHADAVRKRDQQHLEKLMADWLRKQMEDDDDE